jgi:glycosyltransferase involved in cell wall biosynthesis
VAEPSIIIDGRIIFRPQCRGIGRATIGLVERFPADGPPVRMLVPRTGESPFDLETVAKRADLVETDLSVTAIARTRKLSHLLAKLDAGVLYCPYHPLVPLRAPCPVITTVHDCILEEDPVYAGGRMRQLAFIGLTRLALRRSSAVTVPSQATAHSVVRHYPGAKVAGVASNGVEVPSGPRPGPEETREALGLPDRYLLHVGARRPHKNQSLLVEVLARLDPSLSLVLVGDADPRVDDPVQGVIDRLGLADRVRMLEKVPDRHMAGLYGGAEVFVFPSLQEGYGIPPLEAMASGVPVVASAIPVMAEVCGTAADLVSPFDPDGWAAAIRRIVSDDRRRGEMIDRGRITAAAATWDRGAEALHRLLRQWASRP